MQPRWPADAGQAGPAQGPFGELRGRQDRRLRRGGGGALGGPAHLESEHRAGEDDGVVAQARGLELGLRRVGRHVEQPARVCLLGDVAGQERVKRAGRQASGEPGVEQLALPRAEQQLAQPRLGPGPPGAVAAQHREACGGVVAVAALALGTEVVGPACRRQGLHNRGGSRQGLVEPVIEVAHGQAEPVAQQVSGLELVAVADRREGGVERHAVEPQRLQRRQIGAVFAQDAERLGRVGVLVLHPGVPDVVGRDAQRVRQPTAHGLGGLPLATEPDVDVGALAAGLVQGQLLDHEVGGRRLDDAADAGKLTGEVRTDLRDRIRRWSPPCSPTWPGPRSPAPSPRRGRCTRRGACAGA